MFEGPIICTSKCVISPYFKSLHKIFFGNDMNGIELQNFGNLCYCIGFYKLICGLQFRPL